MASFVFWRLIFISSMNFIKKDVVSFSVVRGSALGASSGVLSRGAYLFLRAGNEVELLLVLKVLCLGL